MHASADPSQHARLFLWIKYAQDLWLHPAHLRGNAAEAADEDRVGFGIDVDEALAEFRLLGTASGRHGPLFVQLRPAGLLSYRTPQLRHGELVSLSGRKTDRQTDG